MKCIRCHKPLNHEQYEGVEVDRCCHCQGLWLDAGELSKIVGTNIETFSRTLVAKTLEAKAVGVPKSENESQELCPKCSTSMKPINYAYESGVILDSCPQGHGIWFDSEELEKVQIFKENEDQKLEQNRSEWHELAEAAKEKAQAEVASQSKLDKISQILLDWLG